MQKSDSEILNIDCFLQNRLLCPLLRWRLNVGEVRRHSVRETRIISRFLVNTRTKILKGPIVVFFFYENLSYMLIIFFTSLISD